MTLPLLGAGPTGGAATFDPLSLSPALWFKADAITGKVDGDVITQWDDSSGNARHASQATVGRQPTYETNELNGKPVLRFVAASNQHLVTAAFSNGDAWTAFVVAKSSTAASQRILGTGRLNMSYINVPPLSFQADVIGGTGTTFDLQAVTSGAFSVLTGRQDATSIQAWVDGASNGSSADTPGAATSSTATIGKDNGGFSTFLNGDVAEVLLFTSALSSTDRGSVQAYLGTKYGITVA